jgi:hypothetical protein
MNLYPPPHPTLARVIHPEKAPRVVELHITGARVVAWVLRGLLITLFALAAIG